MFAFRWLWPFAGTMALLAFFAAVRALVTAIDRIGDTRGCPDALDPVVDELWHRYEEGDLTREEYQRERREHLAQKDKARPAA